MVPLFPGKQPHSGKGTHEDGHRSSHTAQSGLNLGGGASHRCSPWRAIDFRRSQLEGAAFIRHLFCRRLGGKSWPLSPLIGLSPSLAQFSEESPHRASSRLRAQGLREGFAMGARGSAGPRKASAEFRRQSEHKRSKVAKRAQFLGSNSRAHLGSPAQIDLRPASGGCTSVFRHKRGPCIRGVARAHHRSIDVSDQNYRLLCVRSPTPR